MTRAVIQFVAQDKRGDIVPGAAVEVRDADSDALVQVWNSRTGGSLVGNPGTTDSSGLFRGYVNPGRVNVSASKGTFSRAWNDVVADDSTSPYINVKDFGAKGDGVTDDTAAIQRALDYAGAKPGSTITGGGATYRVTDQLILPSGVSLVDFVFDMTAMPLKSGTIVYAIQAAGSIGAPVALAQDASAADGPDPEVELTTSDHGIEPDDLIFVTSTQVWADSNPVGELAVVRAVAGATLELSAPLSYSYKMANSAVVRKIIPASDITVQNVRAIGPVPAAGASSAMGFIGFYLCRNVRVKYIDCSYFNRAGVEFRKSFDCHLLGSRIYNIPNWYGCMVLDAAKQIQIRGNAFVNTRHGVTVNGSITLGGGIPNSIIVNGNVSVGREAALDCHHSADNIEFSDNVLVCEGTEGDASGVMFQGRNLTCVGNTIVGNVFRGVHVQPLWGASGTVADDIGRGSIVVANNNIYAEQVGGEGAAGVYVQMGQNANASPKNVSINGNTVSGPFSDGVSVYNVSAAFDDVAGVTINGNTLNGFIVAGIRVRSESHGILSSTLSGNTITAGGSKQYDGVLLTAGGAGDSVRANITGNSINNCATGIRRTGNGGVYVSQGCNDFREVTTPVSSTLYVHTIASGEITLAGRGLGIVRVDTEGEAAADDLDIISGGAFDQTIIVRLVSASREITLKADTGNLRINGDCALATSADTITLWSDGADWLELSRTIT